MWDTVINGNSIVNLEGVVYFPTTHVHFDGNFTGQSHEVAIIADTIEFSGNASFKKLSDVYLPSILTFARLVE